MRPSLRNRGSLCHSGPQFAGSQRRRGRGGRARAREFRARAPAAVLLEPPTPKPKRGKVARPAPLHPSPRKEGEGKGGGGLRERRLPARGMGRLGAGLRSPRAVPAQCLQRSLPHTPGYLPPRIASVQVSIGPTTSVEGCEAKTRAPGLSARLLLGSPPLPSRGGSKSLGMSPSLATTCPCVHPQRQPTSGLHAKHTHSVSHTSKGPEDRCGLLPDLSSPRALSRGSG